MMVEQHEENAVVLYGLQTNTPHWSPKFGEQLVFIGAFDIADTLSVHFDLRCGIWYERAGRVKCILHRLVTERLGRTDDLIYSRRCLAVP